MKFSIILSRIFSATLIVVLFLGSFPFSPIAPKVAYARPASVTITLPTWGGFYNSSTYITAEDWAALSPQVCGYSYDVQGQQDGTGWNPLDCATNTPAPPPDTDGSHTLYLGGWTNSDYTGTYGVNSVTFTYDTVPPAVTIDSPADSADIADVDWGNPQVSWDDSVTCEYHFDSDPYATLDSGCSADTSIAKPAAGPHTLYVRGTDAAGNQTEQQISFTLEAPDGGGGPPAPPNITTADPTDTQTVTSWLPSVNWDTATTCSYSYDNSTFLPATCASNGSDIVAPASGSATLYLKGIDDSAQESDVQVSFTYSPTVVPGPTIVVTSPQEGSQGGWAPVIDWGDATTCYYEYESNGANQLGSCDASLIPAPDGDGSHTLNVYATDADGNMSDTVSVDFNYESNAAIAVTGAASSVTNSTATLHGDGVGPNGGNLDHVGMKLATDAYYNANENGYSTTIGIANIGNTSGSYDFSATDLACNTTYHYQAYAFNDSDGTLIGYGKDRTFMTSACAPTAVGYWAFNEGSGSLAYDSSGSGNTGILQNSPTWDEGKFGGALTLNGTNQYVSVASPSNIPIGNSDYAISAWFKSTVPSAGGIAGWGTYNTSDANVTNAFRFASPGDCPNDNGFDNYWWGDDFIACAPDGVNVFDGEWHHVVAEYDGTHRKMYLDGTQIGVNTPTGALNVSTASNLSIGLTDSSYGEYFNGTLDDVRIYAAALTDGEITGLYNNGNGAGVAPSISVSEPTNEETVTTWSPSVNWDTSAMCSYSYTNANFTNVNCASNGSDIPAPLTSGDYTLYLKGVDDLSQESDTQVSFTYTSLQAWTLAVDDPFYTRWDNPTDVGNGWLNPNAVWGIQGGKLVGNTSDPDGWKTNFLLRPDSENALNERVVTHYTSDNWYAPDLTLTTATVLRYHDSNNFYFAEAFDDRINLYRYLDGTLSLLKTTNLSPYLVNVSSVVVDASVVNDGAANDIGVTVKDQDGVTLGMLSYSDSAASALHTAGNSGLDIWGANNSVGSPFARYISDVQTYSGNAPAPDGEWNFDEGTAGTCGDGSDLCDLSGNNDNGTNNGGEWVPNPTDGAPTPNLYSMDFENGQNANGHDTTMQTRDFGNTFTISAWVKPHDLVNIGTIMGNAYGGGTDGFKLYVNSYNTTDGRLVFETGNGQSGNLSAVSTAGAITDDQWQLVTAVVNKTAGTAELYVNGVDVTEENSIYTNFNTSGAWNIGSMQGAWLYTGQIDDMQVFNSDLSGGQVESLVNAWTAPDGSSDHPLHISSCDDLNAVNDNLSAHYVLETDLDCSADGSNDIVGINSGAAFTGDFNGNGHKITIDETGVEVYGGVFGYTSGATIHDLSIAGSVSGTALMGGLVGHTSNTTIYRIKSTVDVTGSGGSANNIGGLVGEADVTTIDDSYSIGAIAGANEVGGIVGNSYLTTVRRSYFSGSASGTTDAVGGIDGSYIDGGVETSFDVGSIGGSATNKGGIIGHLYSDTGNDVTNNAWDITQSGQASPVGSDSENSYDSTGVNSDGSQPAYFINNTFVEPFIGGWDFEGTWETVFGAYPELQEFISEDVILPSVSISAPLTNTTIFTWSPSINWDTATTCSYKYDDATDYTDLGSCDNEIPAPETIGTHTLHVRGTNTTGSYETSATFDYEAGALGSPDDPIHIASCGDFEKINNNLALYYVLDDNLSCAGEGSAMMVGSSDTPFTGSFNGEGHKITVDIEDSESSDVGLFSKMSNATTTALWIDGTILGMSNTGAIAGIATNGSVISQIKSTANVHGDDNSYIGGIVGALTNSSYVEDTYSSGTVTGWDPVGGIVGNADASVVRRNYFTGAVNATGDNSGGIVGYFSNAAVHDNFSVGTVSSLGGNVGGVIGWNVAGSDISNNFWDSTASGDSNCLGSNQSGGFSGCADVNPDGSGAAYFKGNTSNDPFNAWNFDQTWATVENGYPELQVFMNGQTLTVTSLNDDGEGACTVESCTFRDAIANAREGDTINFADGVTGTITLTQSAALELAHTVSIVGPGKDALAIDFNDDRDNFIGIGGTGTTTISGLTFTNSQASDLYMNTNDSAVLDIVDSAFTDNTVYQPIDIHHGSLNITNTIFENNSANLNGGAAIYSDANGDVNIASSTFNGNTYDNVESNNGYGGGAIAYEGSGSLSIASSSFIGNSAPDGGAILFYYGNKLTIATSTFENNTATKWVGAVDSEGSSLLINGSTFSNNTTQEAGYGTVYNNSDEAIIEDSTFDHNTVTDNEDATGGGAFYNHGQYVGFINDTFFDNVVNGTDVAGGGAIYNDGLTIVLSSTFAGNEALDGGVGTAVYSPVSGSNATVFENDILQSGIGDACAGGAIIDYSGNLDSGTSCGFSGGGDLQNTDPLFSEAGLANNGGPVKTIALQWNSPAINTGNSYFAPTADARGVSRPQGDGYDIGAFEFDSDIDSRAPNISISEPTDSETVSDWAPSINWDTATACSYSYDNSTFTTVDCGSNGTDIAAPEVGEQTLYLVGIDGSSRETDAQVSFTYSPPESQDVTFRYIKWEITAKKAAETCNGGGCIQSSEFQLLEDGSPVSWPDGTTATNPGGANPGPETPGNSIDGNIGSKWLDWHFATGNPSATTGDSNLVIDTSSGITFNGYRWATANDVPERDPVNWQVYGSNDGTNWVLIDSQSGQSVTDDRYTFTPNYSLSEPDPIISVQYYSDSGLTESLGANPILVPGTYYLKIHSDRALQSTPIVNIDSEGEENDVTNGATDVVSGTDYVYTRTITGNEPVYGSTLENITVNATDTNSTTFDAISPVNAGLADAYVQTASYYGGGSGTSEDPYQITDCTELQNVDYHPDANFILENDIDCSATGDWNNGDGFSPIWNFSGTFDGNHKTISDLTISHLEDEGVGLFGETTGNAFIKDLTLDGGSMTGYNDVGGLVGLMSDETTIQDVSSSVSVTGSAWVTGGLVGDMDSTGTTISSSTASGAVSGAEIVGGLIGYANGEISDSYATGHVTGSGSDVGGLIGESDSQAHISNTYATGNVDGGESSDTIGGLIGYNAASVEDSYSSGNVTGVQTLGGLVGYSNYQGTITNSFYNVDTVEIQGEHRVTDYGIYDTQYSAWQDGGYAPLVFSDYFPTTDDNGYYELSTVSDLENLLAFTHTDLISNTFLITAPIDLPDEFYIPYINVAEFNGGDEPITGLHLNRYGIQNNLGFFGSASSNTTISHMNISGADVHGLYQVGVLVGDNYAFIEHSVADGSIQAHQLGGAVGYNENVGIITLTTSTVAVTGSGDESADFGSMAGENDGTITNSSASGDVSSEERNASALGGFVGNDSGNISGSSATGNVSAPNANTGGLGGFVGVQYGGTTHNSYSTGNVTGNDYLGGFIGYMSGTGLSQDYSTGNVIAEGSGSSIVGGFTGQSTSNIDNSFSLGSVMFDDSASDGYGEMGGFIGINEGSVTDAYSTGSVTGLSGVNIGGFAGDNYDLLSNVYSSGIVAGTSAAGFVGINREEAGITDSSWYAGAYPGVAIREDDNAGSTLKATLASGGYGTDASSRFAFFPSSHDVYSSDGTAWDFGRIWSEHADFYPTLQSVPYTYTPITDTVPPVITLAGPNNIIMFEGGQYVDDGATAMDDSDGNLTSSINTVSTVNVITPGDYTVTYNVSDGAGNDADTVTRYVNVKSIGDGSALITPGGGDTEIYIPASITAARLDLSGYSNENTVEFGNSITVHATTTSGVANLYIPANTTITSDNLFWDGILDLPQPATVTVPPSDSSHQTTVAAAFAVGTDDTKLTFDKGVRILFPGMAGKHVGYTRSGVFTQITDLCTSDSQNTGNALADGGDCTIDVGNDLVVWTKHFTTYVTYTESTISDSRGGGGRSLGGSSSKLIASKSTTVPDSGVVVITVRNLKLHMTGNDVRALQTLLIDADSNYPAARALKKETVTGYFGLYTQAALAEYQRARHIAPAIGYFGTKTRIEMKSENLPGLWW